MTTQQKALKWNVYSPDGFSLYPDKQWDSKDEAFEAFKEWVKRFEFQGYYGSAAHGRIPLKDIIIYCKFQQEEAYEEEIVDSKQFKKRMNDLLSEMEDVINEMPYKGDSENESQKIFLTNRLNQLSYAVNGVTDNDFFIADEEE